MLLFGEAEASSAEEQLVRGITEPTEKMVRMSASGLLSQSSLLQMPKKKLFGKAVSTNFYPLFVSLSLF
jgi:hypothetical protein